MSDVAVITCGVLTQHVDAICARRGWDVSTYPLPPLLHQRPERIAPAVRELAEETGCAIHVDRFLGHLIDTYGADGDFTLNAVFVAHITAGEPVPADDVAELRWFALDDLPGRELLAFRSTSEALGLLGT